jgi:hypothetical protein
MYLTILTLSPKPLFLLLPPTYRYIHGFKYCTSCQKWFAPGEEAYKNEEEDRAKQRRPKCSDCNQLLKCKPRNAEGKERLAKLMGREVKRY